MTRRRPRRRLDRSPSPVCPQHQVYMLVGSAAAAVRYYYCPIEGCRCSKKVPRLLQNL